MFRIIKQPATRATLQKRIASIDMLRGLVMIVMALDHTRDFFHAGAFVNDPADLRTTTVALFFTRWVTHFCAPIFILLAGLAAFLQSQKKTKKALSLFLLKRGAWLILLEITIINFGWYFNPQFNFINLQVMWALGAGMIALAALIYLPFSAILTIAIILVAGHNLLDHVHVSGNGPGAYLWSILHEKHVFNAGDSRINFAYPLMPWIGWMAIGYCLGNLFRPGMNAGIRKGILICQSSTLVVIFITLRTINIYGDPVPWSWQSTPVFSFLSYINITKYPPSLDYLLVTGSVGLFVLAFTENAHTRVAKIISVYGRVPLFYYLLHIYFIHLLALPAAALTGYQWTGLVWFTNGVHNVPALRAYGFSLPVVYLVWLFIIAALYPFCKWYDGYKTSNKDKWWLSYL